MKVVYIAGWFRSGSTILGQLLGSIDGFFFGGELRYFWRNVLADRDRCGCDKTYSRCDIWRRVREGIGDVDRERMLELDRRVLLTRHFGRVRRDASEAREYRTALGRLYASIKHVTGARVVVDSSKAPAYGLALSGLENIDLSVVHLIRDPRATAFSRLRKPYQEETGVVASALLWDTWNLVIERWFGDAPQYVRIRYEDFATRPRMTIARVLDMIAETKVSVPFTAADRPVLAETHSVAGNPGRFRVGEVDIAVDDAWKQSLPRSKWAVISGLTWPLLRRYGYPVGGRQTPVSEPSGLGIPSEDA